MTYEDLFVAIATEAPNMTGSALKLLLHLIGRAVETGAASIHASDRQLSEAAGIARSQLPDAKRTLAAFFPVDARQGATSAFNLPANWFPPQRLLFSTATGPESRPVLARNPGQQWPGNQATAGPESTPTGMENGPEWPGKRAGLARITGQTGMENGPVGPESGPATTQNQQDSGALRLDSNSNSCFIPDSVVIEIDRVLDTVEISPDQYEEANLISQHIHLFMQQRGEPAAASRKPPVEIVAKCMAVAPAQDLLQALENVSKNRKVRPGSYIWFVVVFLDQCKGIPWKTTKQRMDERKARKQPRRAAPLPFPAEMTRQLAQGVRKMS